MATRREQKNIWLVNPWIYDFAAYDLWIKPLGLLYVGGALRRNGYRIHLLDCLDRNHPDMRKLEKSSHREPDGRGKFHRQIIEKPEALSWVPRHFARYGYTDEVFNQQMEQMEPPDAILVTSIMTYWYKGVEAVVRRLKQRFPEIPVLLGGVYATLCPGHASTLPGIDHVVQGYGEETAVRWLDEYFDIQQPFVPGDPQGDPGVPWDLYPELSALVVLTARGCPYRCTFCATHQLNNRFFQRRPQSVVDEITLNTARYGVKDVVFYDDALFVKKRKHIEAILDLIIESDLEVRFHTPNGLFARMIDRRLAEKMAAANFRTLRLSFETSNEGRRPDMNNKVTNTSFLRAMDILEQAGYPRDQIEVYVLMGLPGQTQQEVRASLEFVHKAGARIRLASFTPIPGTVDFQRAVDRYDLDPDTDPLLLNNTIYPLRTAGMSYEVYSSLRQYGKDLNHHLREVPV
ncbi:MAG TPA: radical SAM protein [bacterium]|nr:radical SAM protein [bacterium]